MTESTRIPGGVSAWPEAAESWLETLGCSTIERKRVLAEAPLFAPATLKQVFTAVMDLGRRAGRLGETMALLGHQEAEFHRLRTDIGIPRAAPPDALIPAAVIIRTSSGWMAPGGWVPDLLDRAAGLDVLNESGMAPAPVSPQQALESGAQHLFVLTSVSEEPDSPVADFASSMPEDGIHIIEEVSVWLSPGPGLPHAVFEAASRMHGLSAVFSDRASS